MRLFFALLLLLPMYIAAEQVVLITGASQGIGKATADAFYHAGWDVWASSRHPKEATKPRYHQVEMDVTSERGIREVVKRIVKESGRIDLLVNNAGYGVIGAVEEVEILDAMRQFDVNLFGVMRMVQAVAPIMREQGGGKIFNISSTSGVRAVAGLGLYAASKFALEGYTEALAVELTPWDVQVALIQPGAVNNAWASHCTRSPRESRVELYETLAMNLQEKLIKLSETGQDCRDIAALMVNVAQRDRIQLRYQTHNKVRDIVSSKLVDLSGEKYLETQRIFYHTILRAGS